MECQKDSMFLFLTAMTTGTLWILSEIIGSSKCKAGGVFEFMLYGFCVEVRLETLHAVPGSETPENTVSETSLLMVN